MSVFGHAIRIINENESPLPVTKLSHEPSPFDTGGCEVKSSMTYILKKDAEKPGKRGTLFGKEKRDRGALEPNRVGSNGNQMVLRLFHYR